MTEFVVSVEIAVDIPASLSERLETLKDKDQKAFEADLKALLFKKGKLDGDFSWLRKGKWLTWGWINKDIPTYGFKEGFAAGKYAAETEEGEFE